MSQGPHREVQERQRYQPEDRKAEDLLRSDVGRLGNSVDLPVIERWPNGRDTRVYCLTS